MQPVTWMVLDMLGLDMLGHVVLLLAEVGADGALVLTSGQPAPQPPPPPHSLSHIYHYFY